MTGDFGSSRNWKNPFRPCSPSDGCPNPTFRPKLQVQGQLDVQGCPEPPVQGHLDGQRCPKPPVQGQLDVQKLPETASPELTSAQSAEPPFLLAGAVLSRVRRLCGKTENRLQSTKNHSEDTIGTSGVQKLDFFRRCGANLSFKGAQNGRSRANLACKGTQNCRSRASLSLEGAQNYRSRGNLTFKGAQNRRSSANLTFKGAQNCRSSANLTFKSCPTPPVQGQLEQQCNKTIKVTRQDKTSANAIERQCSKTIKGTRQDKTSANATERRCS